MIIVLNDNADQEAINALNTALDDLNISYLPLSGPSYQAYHLTNLPMHFEATKQLAPYEAVKKIIALEPSPHKNRETAILSDNFLHKLLKKDELFLIGGPCSIESEQQLTHIAEVVKKSGAQALRGGAFKPRTSPYSFQGMGLVGLKLLHKVAKQYELLSVSEIVSVNDIDFFIKYIDIIQVGARNMQNFELLKALAKTNKPILLKRGFGNTIEEWLSSAEYLLKDGNPNVILCERGVRTFDREVDYVLDLNGMLHAKRLSHLPIIVDPSHAAFDSTDVAPLAKAGIVSGAQGVMIEVHPTPDKALSDGNHALNIKKYQEIASQLRVLYKNNMSH